MKIISIFISIKIILNNKYIIINDSYIYLFLSVFMRLMANDFLEYMSTVDKISRNFALKYFFTIFTMKNKQNLQECYFLIRHTPDLPYIYLCTTALSPNCQTGLGKCVNLRVFHGNTDQICFLYL